MAFLSLATFTVASAQDVKTGKKAKTEQCCKDKKDCKKGDKHACKKDANHKCDKQCDKAAAKLECCKAGKCGPGICREGCTCEKSGKKK